MSNWRAHYFAFAFVIFLNVAQARIAMQLFEHARCMLFAF